MGSRVQIGWPPLTRGVKVLIIIYGVVFLGQVIAELALGTERYGGPADGAGDLPSELRSRGHVWQIITYQFLHSLDGWTHLLFNALALYFFGGQVEMREGTKRFLTVVPDLRRRGRPRRGAWWTSSNRWCFQTRSIR